jgi:spore germination protein KC
LAEIKGVALFKEGKLRSWLDGDKVRGVLWIQNKIESSIITTDCKDEKEAISIEIVRAKTGVTAEVLAEKPIIHINIRQEGYVGEVTCPIDLTKKEEIAKLEKEWERETEKQVMEAVKAAQSEKSDIFGFGEVVNRANPKAWKKMKKEWNNTFAESKVDVKVDAFIRLPGKRTNPVEEK